MENIYVYVSLDKSNPESIEMFERLETLIPKIESHSVIMKQYVDDRVYDSLSDDRYHNNYSIVMVSSNYFNEYHTFEDLILLENGVNGSIPILIDSIEDSKFQYTSDDEADYMDYFMSDRIINKNYSYVMMSDTEKDDFINRVVSILEDFIGFFNND